jgi:hypothetical protein
LQTLARLACPQEPADPPRPAAAAVVGGLRRHQTTIRAVDTRNPQLAWANQIGQFGAIGCCADWGRVALPVSVARMVVPPRFPGRKGSKRWRHPADGTFVRALRADQAGRASSWLGTRAATGHDLRNPCLPAPHRSAASRMAGRCLLELGIAMLGLNRARGVEDGR